MLKVGSWKLEVKRKYKYEILCHTELVEVKIITIKKQLHVELVSASHRVTLCDPEINSG
tara:strand:- start:22122 stop:22298 length:177 start_codon:yes stop_codon:yes gene_type:complete